MPFPDIDVLNRFLDDYLEIRQKEWSSPLGTVKSSLAPVVSSISNSLSASVSSFFSGATAAEHTTTAYQDDATLRTGLCESLKERFGNLENRAAKRKNIARTGKKILCSAKR